MLSDEEVGQLLAESAQCGRDMKDLKSSVGQLQATVSELVSARDRASGSITAARAILGTILGVLMTVVGWGANELLEHRSHIAEGRALIQRVDRDVERHEVTNGHSGHGEIAGEVRELRVQMNGLDERLGEVQSDVRELAHRGGRR